MPDDFDAVIAERFEVLDELAVPDTWARVQSRLLDHPPDRMSEQDTTVVDLASPSAGDGRRSPFRRVLVAALATAAAFAAVVLVAARDDDPVGPAAPPSPAVSVPSGETPAPGGEVTNILNPLVDIRSRLTSRGDVELFRVNADAPAYWRVTTLSAFDGQRFGLPSRPLERFDDEPAESPGGASEIRQQIQVLSLGGILIPAAADPVGAEGFSPDGERLELRLNRDTSSLLAPDELEPGDLFSIVSERNELTPDVLRGATTAAPPDEIFVELPDDLPDVVGESAQEVTAGTTNGYDAAMALQSWFRDPDEFSYSLEVQSGHGNDAVEEFLRIREGFSEQFAATFATMARTLGIPSRVAVGFTPGVLNDEGWYGVSGRHAHAWPELWFDGIGWVAFEPTPGRGAPGAAAYSGVPPAQDESRPTGDSSGIGSDTAAPITEDGPIPTDPAPSP